MINLEGGPEPTPAIPVAANNITFTGGNSSSPADGSNNRIENVSQSSIFSAGDTIQVHNLDGTGFIGTVNGVQPGSVILDTPLTIPVNPGAALVKLVVSVVHHPLIQLPDVIFLPNTGANITTINLPSGTRTLQITHLAGEVLTNFSVLGVTSQANYFPVNPDDYNGTNSLPSLQPGQTIAFPVDSAVDTKLQIAGTVGTKKNTLKITAGFDNQAVWIQSSQNNPIYTRPVASPRSMIILDANLGANATNTLVAGIPGQQVFLWEIWGTYDAVAAADWMRLEAQPSNILLGYISSVSIGPYVINGHGVPCGAVGDSLTLRNSGVAAKHLRGGLVYTQQ